MDSDHNQNVVNVNEDQSLLSDGSTDYRGQIAKRDRTGGWRTGPFILGPETCEKMAVQGIVINLVPYLTGKFHLPSSYAANLVTTYQGTSYMFTLLGGFTADAFAGRFQVIASSSVILFFGLVILTASATFPFLKPKDCSGTTCHAQTGTPLIILYAALYLIALGTGGVKACASPFGADQFDPHHEEEKKNLDGFFSWYFFAITCGAFFAVIVLVYIQEHVGREWGYFIPTVAMLMVVIAFVMGRKLYRFKTPKGSPFSLIAKVLVSAFRKRKLHLPSDENELYELSKKDQPNDYICVKHSNQFKCLDKAAIEEDLSVPHSRSPWRLNTLTSVEETKMVVRLLPILITTSLFYTVYAQMTTFSVGQGHTMERRIGGKFEFPAASMAGFLQGAILLTLFFWERAFVPFARGFTGNKKGVTSLQRIGVGLAISIITMIVAALVEKERMRHFTAQHLSEDPDIRVHMSIFWLLPQYILVGSGEALTYAGQLDFFYNESPKAMRSMGAAMCVCTLSIGYYTSSLLVSLVNSITGHTHPDGTVTGAWLPDNINGGKLYNFYWLLAVASSLNFVLFQVSAHWYKYRPEAGLVDEFCSAQSRRSSQMDDSEDVDLRGKIQDKVPNGSSVKQDLPADTSNGSRDSSTQQKLQQLASFGPVGSSPRSKSMDAVRGELEIPQPYIARTYGTNGGSIKLNLEQLHPQYKKDRTVTFQTHSSSSPNDRDNTTKVPSSSDAALARES